MAIEIPHEVALFLNFAGVPYPDINEDHVRELAGHVRGFAASVQGTHTSATTAITDMNAVYSGYSYEQLVASWARMSADHLAGLDQACATVAAALDVTAGVITTTKIAVLSELAAMAASYATAMAATVATSGLSTVLGQVILAAARKIVQVMEQMILAYILSEVVMKAIEPLEHLVDEMLQGVLYNAAADVLGVGPGTSTALPLYIEPDEVRRYAGLLDQYADDMITHANDFADNVGKLTFVTTGPDGSTPDSVGTPATPAPAIPPTTPDGSAVAPGSTTPPVQTPGAAIANPTAPTPAPSWIDQHRALQPAASPASSPPPTAQDSSARPPEKSNPVAHQRPDQTERPHPTHATGLPTKAIAPTVSPAGAPPPHASAPGMSSPTTEQPAAVANQATPHSPTAPAMPNTERSPALDGRNGLAHTGTHATPEPTVSEGRSLTTQAAEVDTGPPVIGPLGEGPASTGPDSAISAPAPSPPGADPAMNPSPTASARTAAAQPTARGRTLSRPANPWRHKSRPMTAPAVSPPDTGADERRPSDTPWSTPAARPVVPRASVAPAVTDRPQVTAPLTTDRPDSGGLTGEPQ